VSGVAVLVVSDIRLPALTAHAQAGDGRGIATDATLMVMTGTTSMTGTTGSSPLTISGGQQAPASSCGVRETARAVCYLAGESAGQCGPCLNGLPRLAQLLAGLAAGRAEPRTLTELERIAGLVEGRGACHHPDGTVRLLRSSLHVFRAEIDQHLAGRCRAISAAPVLPTPP